MCLTVTGDVARLRYDLARGIGICAHQTRTVQDLIVVDPYGLPVVHFVPGPPLLLSAKMCHLVSRGMVPHAPLLSAWHGSLLSHGVVPHASAPLMRSAEPRGVVPGPPLRLGLDELCLMRRAGVRTPCWPCGTFLLWRRPWNLLLLRIVGNLLLLPHWVVGDLLLLLWVGISRPLWCP